MYLTSYFTSPNQPQLLAQLRACEWGAAKFLTELLEKEQFHHTLGAGDCYFLMAGDQIAAFATLTDRDCVDAPELRPWCGFVYTFPAYRHQRIAGKLLQVFLDFAEGNHLAFLSLEVRASNYDAIALYGSRGFRSVGRRKNYYEHPREDAIIMTKEFEHHGAETANA